MRYTIFFVIVFLFCTWSLTAQRIDDLQSFVKQEKALIQELESEYDAVVYDRQGSFIVQEGDLFGYYVDEVGEVLPPIYDRILTLSDSEVALRLNDLWAIYKNGEPLTEFAFTRVLGKVGDGYAVYQGKAFGIYFTDGTFHEDDFYKAGRFDMPPKMCHIETGECGDDFSMELLKNVAFPPLARELGLSGRVILELYISEFGDLDYAFVVQSAGYLLDQAVLELFETHDVQFDPAILDGVPVASMTRLPFSFRRH